MTIRSSGAKAYVEVSGSVWSPFLPSSSGTAVPKAYVTEVLLLEVMSFAASLISSYFGYNPRINSISTPRINTNYKFYKNT